MGLFDMFNFDGGGIGNSGPSTSSTTTETNDMRVVGAEGSVNSSTKIDVSGTGNSLTTTDHGAVSGAIQAILRGYEANSMLAKEAIASNGGVMTGALSAAGAAQSQFTDALEKVKTSDVRILLFVGLAVVGVVGVMAFKKGG